MVLPSARKAISWRPDPWTGMLTIWFPVAESCTPTLPTLGPLRSTATNLPSGETIIRYSVVAGSWTLVSAFPVLVSRRRTSTAFSPPAQVKVRPSTEKAVTFHHPFGTANRRSRFPVATSQRCKLPSESSAASVLPSGEKLRDDTLLCRNRLEPIRASTPAGSGSP